MKPNCVFQIARGNTCRYVYVFKNYGDYYLVTLKKLLGNAPYQNVSTVRVPTSELMVYINTVVATTF